MAELVRCTDCLGRLVVLTDTIWNDHVLVRRPELSGLEACVEQVVTDPYRIMQDDTIPTRECMYRHRTLPGILNRLYFKVVVAFRPSGPSGLLVGTVVTAYPTDRIKKTEKQLWP